MENGADVDLCSKDKITPFHEAYAKGHESIVQILLNKGADTNAISMNKGSPLLGACD